MKALEISYTKIGITCNNQNNRRISNFIELSFPHFQNLEMAYFGKFNKINISIQLMDLGGLRADHTFTNFHQIHKIFPLNFP